MIDRGLAPAPPRARRTVNGQLVVGLVFAPCFLAFAVAVCYLAAIHGWGQVAQFGRWLGWLSVPALVTPVMVVAWCWKRLRRRRQAPGA